MWKVSSESFKGKIKKEGNNRCQDKIAYKNKEGFLAIGLSDGNGSKFYGDVGAEIAINTAIDYIEKNFVDLYKKENFCIGEEILLEVKRQLRKKSVYDDYKFKELGATLNLVVVKKEKYIILLLGDGFIGEIDKKGNTIEYSNKYSGDKTKYLTTTSNAKDNIIVKKGALEKRMEFLICSDGVIEEIDKEEIREKEIIKTIKKRIKLEKKEFKDDFSYIIAKKL